LQLVLHYPSVRAKFPDLTDEISDQFIKRLNFRATFIHSVRHRFDYPRAHQDEPYLDLAAHVKAHYLVSRDKDLLSLMESHTVFAKQFRQSCPGIRVVKPEDFLEYVQRTWIS